jgi:hypothetical protein
MDIGIWTDTDSNLAAMKISAWHKEKGDSVERWFPIKQYDRIYASKVFGDEYTQLPATPFMADEVIYGGTGFNISISGGKEKYIKENELPPEIEHIYPDYDLFGCKRAMGFATRGCPNACGFCLVSRKEGIVSHKVADISEFWRGQKVIDLLDPNLLACDQHEEIIKQLIDSGAKVIFNQGLDARFITERNAELLSHVRTKIVHFALDLPKNTEKIIAGLKTYIKFNPHVNPHDIIVYVLTNYNTDYVQDIARIKRLQEIGVKPDVRIYRKNSAPQLTRDLARWVNNKYIYWSEPDFMNYVPRKDGKTIKEIYFGG